MIDLRPMVEIQRARDQRLEADEGVREARERYVAALDAYDAARRTLDEASSLLAAETRRVLRA